jgi:hypothetical protein
MKNYAALAALLLACLFLARAGDLDRGDRRRAPAVEDPAVMAFAQEVQ